MAKIMLVEDDNNLREIYEARLLAEGYEIVSAKDGEEALALAVKEKPDLIISDVMMPKISGFDMLDILRSTAETKNTKVIMMTALSQAEDKSRADKLGADRYLVKSQVTLEDVAKVAHDVLAGEDQTSPAAPESLPATPAPVVAPEPAAAPQPAPAPEPVQAPPMATPKPVASEPAAAPSPAPEPPVTPTPIPVSEPTTAAPVPDATAAPTTQPEPAETESPTVDAPADAEPQQVPTEAAPQPLESAAVTPNAINDDLTQTTAAEEAAIESQISAIFSEPPTTDPVPEPPAPEPVEAPQPDTIEVATPPVETAQPEPEVSAPPETAPTTPIPVATPEPEAAQQPTPPDVDQPNGKRVINPINDITKTPDLNDLLKKEEADAPIKPPTATTVLSPEPAPKPMQDVTPPPANPQAGSTVAPGDIAL
jgi:CheY-like chemotaxis protein